MTNSADNAQIELTDAQTEQTKINTLLNLAQTLDNETLVERICDVLDLDYNKVKAKLPDEDESGIEGAQSALNGVVTDEPEAEGSSAVAVG